MTEGEKSGPEVGIYKRKKRKENKLSTKKKSDLRKKERKQRKI